MKFTVTFTDLVTSTDEFGNRKSFVAVGCIDEHGNSYVFHVPPTLALVWKLYEGTKFEMITEVV